MAERVEAMKAIWTAGRGQLPRRVRRLRAHLVVAQARAAAAPAGARRRQRPDRARPRARASATPGFPTTDRRACSTASRSCAPAPTARSNDGDGRCPPSRRCSSAARAPAAGASCTGSRRAKLARGGAGAGALGGGDRRGHRRGVTARRGARSGSPRRGSRGWPRPTPAAARTWCRSCSRCDGRLHLQRRRRQAQAHDGAAAAGQRRARTRAWRCWPTTTRRTGARCGGCAPTGAGACSSRGVGRPGRGAEAARAVDLLRARYPQQRAVGAVLAVDVERWSGWSAAG